METRRIASLRIHVERAIERIKNFQALHHISINTCVVTSRLVKVCTFLTTLMPPLVPATDLDEALQDTYADITVVD